MKNSEPTVFKDGLDANTLASEGKECTLRSWHIERIVLHVEESKTVDDEASDEGHPTQLSNLSYIAGYIGADA